MLSSHYHEVSSTELVQQLVKYLNEISFVLTVEIDKNSMHFLNHGNSVIRLHTYPSSWHLLKEKINMLVITS